MTVQEYIDNGFVLDYCLGHLKGADKRAFEHAMKLYPQLEKEVAEVQNGLEKYSEANRIAPHSSMKEKIWATLQNLQLEKEMDLSHLPLINKYSDPKAWLKAVTPLLPKQKEDFFYRELTGTDKVTQVLVMTRMDVAEEVHHKVHESFMILVGECECHIGGKVIQIKAGGYVEIPLHENHDLRLISEYVVGIVQRLAA
jgi:mannose-6-phosphate isomerase-like protein (cupin superfamily)